MSAVVRCPWAEGSEAMAAYHDEEWGRPEHDERRLFELVTLEGAQAGLSWSIVLNKRHGYRQAFAGFDPDAVALFTPADVDRLVGEAGIVRHRGKIESVVANARAIGELHRSGSSLNELIWSVVDGRTVRNAWGSLSDAPTRTPQAEAMAKLLRRHGLKFVGPTTCYSLMQAAGLVNDHMVECFRWNELDTVAQQAGG